MLKTTFALFVLASSVANAGVSSHYKTLKEIPIGGEGGWDYVSLDSTARKLYLSHATKVIVVDLEKGKISGEILDTPGVHGFAIAPELGRGFSSNGKENKVSIVDLKTLKTLSKISTGENPDAILYDPKQQEVYAFNGRSKSATIIQAKTGKIVATLPLPGKPEFAAVDPEARRVYVNIEDKSRVVAIDTVKHVIASNWSVAPGDTPSALSIDLKNHRLFIGCENLKMVMMDSTTGRVITSVPIEKGVDANAFDSASMMVFSSNGSGTVTVAHEQSPDSLQVIQTLKTEKGARTLALDPLTKNIYLPSAQFDPQSSGEHRPKIISGTQKLLVYGL